MRRSGEQGGALVELPLLILIAVAVAFVLKTFVGQAFFIPSESMEPQLDIGDRVLVSKVAYDVHDPRRGDIVVFPAPGPKPADDDPLPVSAFHDILEAVGLRQPDQEVLIKRVIGLPGETVEARNGHVYVNGRLLVEPYLPESITTEDFGPVAVPDGQLWVMGDNRPRSRDSHVFGPIKESDVVGRAILKVWPPGSASFL